MDLPQHDGSGNGVVIAPALSGSQYAQITIIGGGHGHLNTERESPTHACILTRMVTESSPTALRPEYSTALLARGDERVHALAFEARFLFHLAEVSERYGETPDDVDSEFTVG